MQQTTAALTLLHSARITHRDLNPENILVQRKTPLSVKLADFGLGTDRSVQETFCGSSLYVVPEVVQYTVYTTAIDIWSLGVLVLQYWCGRAKWNLIRRGRGKIRGNSGWHSDLVQVTNEIPPSRNHFDLVRQMLRIEPSSRADAKTCLSMLSGESISRETSEKGKVLLVRLFES